ncbi:hypothetical protein FS837_006999 [Tulasnella sp. UAMH 9824]|nr:hypothetical protein FS837_006999 [Tulasnella sp. UAMH 9824]
MSTSPSAIQELVFNGADGTEAEDFIRSVMKVARAAGKLGDNSWIAEEAAVAFTGEALRRRPSTVPTPAASAPHPGSVPSIGASEKASYIRVVVQDTGRSFYVGLKNGDAVAVSARSEGVMVRHDRATKALHVLERCM